jgi:hypothetical protein
MANQVLRERMRHTQDVVVLVLDQLLVSSLSCRRQRVIRMRANAAGARFIVDGSGGAVYVVNPGDWSCSCPAHYRRGSGCQHALACWALAKAAGRRASARTGALHPCASCGDAVLGHEAVEVGPDKAQMGDAFKGQRFCRQCGRRRGVL